MIRLDPSVVIETSASGHTTSPSTVGFLVRSQVPSSLIQSPVLNAPGAFELKLVSQEKILLTSGDDTGSAPIGSAVTSARWDGAQELKPSASRDLAAERRTGAISSPSAV